MVTELWHRLRRRAGEPKARLKATRPISQREPDIVDVDYWREHQNPTDADIEKVARVWISYQVRSEGRELPDDDPEWWAVEAVIDANEDSRVEVLWRLILKLCELADPDPLGVLGMVAAGPLCDIINFRSGDWLGRVEATAPDNPKLLAALAGVWSDPPIDARIDRFLAAQGQERRSS